MTRTLREQHGFTLIELLVVILIIGVLAAVALPTFLGQRDKGFDADAKSNARNLQTMVESCGVDNAGNYANCDTAAKLTTAGANVGSLPVGTGAGQVNITGAGQDAYTITAYSKSKSGTNQKTFTLVKTATSLTKGGTGTW